MTRAEAVHRAAVVVVTRHRAGLSPRAQEFLRGELCRVVGYGPGGDVTAGLRRGEIEVLRNTARRLAPEVESTVRELTGEPLPPLAPVVNIGFARNRTPTPRGGPPHAA